MVTATTTAAATPTDPYTTSADLLTQAQTGANQFQGSLLGSINDYVNPYYDQVISNTLGRMQDDRTQTLNQVGDAAAAAGAFGGSRHGIVESQVYDDYNRNMSEYADGAYANAYNNATALQNQDFAQQMQLSGMNQNLGNTYLGIGNAIQNQQSTYGTQEQNLLQTILSGGQQEWASMMEHPYQIIDALNAALSLDPRSGAGSAQQSSTPGLFDYLSLAAGTATGILG